MQSIAPAPAPVPQSLQNQDMSADNDLRAQLAAVINVNPQQGQQQQTHSHPPHGYNENIQQQSSSASPRDHNIDPSIAGGPQGGMMSAGNASGDDDSLGDGRKGGKRELSQSKRAAQNRAAQRAFRQRKEGYIKKLEEQVHDFHHLEDNYKAIQAENYSLREYIIHLQSRLIESQGEYPQPPPNVNLIHPHARQDPNHPPHHMQSLEGVPVAPMGAPLQASAARTLAAAGLQAKHGQDDRSYDAKRYQDTNKADNAADDDIIRSQLQASADGLPSTMAV